MYNPLNTPRTLATIICCRGKREKIPIVWANFRNFQTFPISSTRVKSSRVHWYTSRYIRVQNSGIQVDFMQGMQGTSLAHDDLNAACSRVRGFLPNLGPANRLRRRLVYAVTYDQKYITNRTPPPNFKLGIENPSIL